MSSYSTEVFIGFQIKADIRNKLDFSRLYLEVKEITKHHSDDMCGHGQWLTLTTFGGVFHLYKFFSYSPPLP